MSHYPQPPYFAPSPYAGPGAASYPPPAAGPPAARRAGTLMFVLGPLVLLLGGCILGSAALLPVVAKQNPQQVEELRSRMGLPADFPLAAFLGVAGAVIGLPGAALLGLAVFVRRGRRWAQVTALVVAGLVLAYLGLNLLAALFHFAGGINPVGICVGILGTAAFGLLVAWLAAALRSGPGPGDPYQQYLAHYYQHQQAAQAYGASPGYGYGAAQTPPTPPVEPPPTTST